MQYSQSPNTSTSVTVEDTLAIIHCDAVNNNAKLKRSVKAILSAAKTQIEQLFKAHDENTYEYIKETRLMVHRLNCVVSRKNACIKRLQDQFRNVAAKNKSLEAQLKAGVAFSEQDSDLQPSSTIEQLKKEVKQLKAELKCYKKKVRTYKAALRDQEENQYLDDPDEKDAEPDSEPDDAEDIEINSQVVAAMLDEPESDPSDSAFEIGECDDDEAADKAESEELKFDAVSKSVTKNKEDANKGANVDEIESEEMKIDVVGVTTEPKEASEEMEVEKLANAEAEVEDIDL